MKRFLLCLSVLFSLSIYAADVRVTGLGNTNYFPVWRNGNSVTTNSQLYQLGVLIGIGTTNPLTKLQVSETNTVDPRGLLLGQYSTGTNGSLVSYRKARGTELNPTILVTGDNLFRNNFAGYDGANYLNSAGIEAKTTGTIVATRVPSEVNIWTSTDATPSVPTIRLNISPSGNLTHTGAALTTSGEVAIGINSALKWTSRSKITSPGDGLLNLLNGAENNFDRLNWGPATASFPAAKRSAATLAFRLADDSADAAITAAGVTASGNIIASGAASVIRLKGYTVATLPATPVQGNTAFVTDATAPVYLATVIGGGAVVTPVFYNGSAWVCH